MARPLPRSWKPFRMTSRREYRPVPKALTGLYTVPSGTVCISVQVPDAEDHINLLQSVMALLTDIEMWQGEDEDRALFASAWQEAFTLTDWSNCVPEDTFGYAGIATLWHTFATVITGGAISRTVDTAQMFASIVGQLTPANGDSRYQNVFLKPGDYKVTLLGLKQSASGQLYMFLTNEDTTYQEDVFNTLEFYAAATTRNFYATADITLTEPVQRCYFQIVGKNASSSGYGVNITAVWFERQDLT